jgi:hypothetical protein
VHWHSQSVLAVNAQLTWICWQKQAISVAVNTEFSEITCQDWKLGPR